MQTVLRSTSRINFSVLFFFIFMTCSVRLVGATINNIDFAKPPQEYGVRCWWWWLNGNVTKDAITRDLEAMREKGFSGAMIFDAGGAEQRGNAQVPEGPLYGSEAWQELFLHALNEAERLGLTLGLSIQSGWNLGGPTVTAEYAAKQLCWSETIVDGEEKKDIVLATPNHHDGYYRDICVLAWPIKEGLDYTPFTIQSGSHQSSYPIEKAVDQDRQSFWVSQGKIPGEGPRMDRPEWIKVTFEEPVMISGLNIEGRKGYGPKSCRIFCQDKKTKTDIFQLADGQNKVQFDPIEGKQFIIEIYDAYDPRSNDAPRNVQICSLSLVDVDGTALMGQPGRYPIENLTLKSGFRELGGSAPDCRFMLNDRDGIAGEEDVRREKIIDLTDKLGDDGQLDWQPQPGDGRWVVLRMGYTTTRAEVSTYSGQWKGHVIDYLSKDAFDQYWRDVVDLLLDVAGPKVGQTLKQLETDSWECGGMNWSDGFEKEFIKYRGYDPIGYLPVIAGKIVDSREKSNAFLADLRKTLADCVANNHYKRFAEYAHERGLEIQPESGGPHAGPLDAIKNLGHSDLVMGEFWVPSPHRPRPENRFFIKQAASAAHIYGKRYVAAESFTSIGPHWNDVLWKSQKPSMDHEFCSGLNMVFFHTFTCSPKEMGLPGQEYFAGTHTNPQVTWWEYSDAYMNYINRCHYMTQQGRFVADVLYYYGDHVPVLAQLKESDPAKVLPGYDYDVTNEDVFLQLKVVDGKVVVPSGLAYSVLVLPDHKVLSMAVLEKVLALLKNGARIVGEKPERLVSLVGGEADQKRFKLLSTMIWGNDLPEKGRKRVGKGELIWGEDSRDVLRSIGIEEDFRIVPGDDIRNVDYIHYTIDAADVYFVCNQTDQARRVDCSFRINGKAPELWDPVRGTVLNARAYQQKDGRITLPIEFDPYGSYFVVFRDPIAKTKQGNARNNFPTYKSLMTIDGEWQVGFDPEWSDIKHITMETLSDWSQSDEDEIRYYSGTARYTNSFELKSKEAGQRYWLDLGRVEDIGIATVSLNGQAREFLWTKPFRIDITDQIKQGGNQLEVTVTNSWRNRLIGDRKLPAEKRRTKTNITVTDQWRLEPSGLLGPVEVLTSTDE